MATPVIRPSGSTAEDTGAIPPALALSGLRKRFGDFTAVDGIDLEVPRGEFLTLLGPSGSGKTTTLRMVAGFAEPDAGRVRLDDRDLSGVPPYKRDIGMVFQNYALFPHMTAAGNIGFPLQMRGVGRAETSERVAKALALVQLEDFGERRPAQLSGGQQQRVALARAIVYDPRLLLMDEPLGALDKKLREALQLEVRRISTQLGITVLYVTHDQEEALVISDRIAIYNHGRIEQVGTGEDLYERPSSYFVADFMGESNIFRGEWAGDGAVATPAGRLRAGEGADGSGRRPGEGVAVVVRPERLVLVSGPAPEADDAMNGVRATVREAIYLGSARKYELRTPDGVRLSARVPMGGAGETLEPGQEIEVRWRVADGVLVADPGAEAASPMPAADT